MSTIAHLKAMCARYKPSIVAILEPKISCDRLEGIRREIGFDYCLHGAGSNNHIWLCWKEGVKIDQAVWSSQQVTVHIQCNVTNAKFVLSIVYADCVATIRKALWEDLIEASDGINKPWFIAGDFNVISSGDEKQGGCVPEDGPIVAFNEFQLAAGVSDVGFKGNPFTWSNNQSGADRIWERLDCTLVNGLALAEFPRLQVSHLERICSDHCPLLIELRTG
ncbi:hypothetical protein QQ045_021150 [Rhodiola kirilowii]